MGKKQISVDNIFAKRINVKDYQKLTTDVREIVDYTIRHNLNNQSKLGVAKEIKQPIFNDIFELRWEQLIELEELIKEADVFQVLQMVYEITEEEFLDLEIYNCFAAYQFVVNELNELHKMEEAELSSEPSPEQIAAGVEDLNRFGYYNNLDFLAKGNIMVYDELLKKPYSIIFRKLALEKTKSDIQTRYSENVSRKIKNH